MQVTILGAESEGINKKKKRKRISDNCNRKVLIKILEKKITIYIIINDKKPQVARSKL